MGGAVESFVSGGLDMVSGGLYSASRGNVPYTGGRLSLPVAQKIAGAVTAPPLPPELDPAAIQARDQAEREALLKAGIGAAATISGHGYLGDTSTPTTAARTILGVG